MAATRKRPLIDPLTPSLHKVMDGDLRFEDASIIPVWKRYLARGRRENFLTIQHFYLRLVGMMVGWMMKRNPSRFNEEYGVYFSDGFLGLDNAIKNMKSPPDPTAFCKFACRLIKGAIWYQHFQRQWGGQPARRGNIVAEVRADLIGRLGRVPDRRELTDAIRGRVSNQSFYIDRALRAPRQQVSFSELEADDSKPRSYADDRADDPSGRALGAEAIRLAMKGLKPVDKKLLKMMLRGETFANIGRTLGRSEDNVRKRLNGVLWESRCRADLAAYLGVEPDAKRPAYANARTKEYPRFEAKPARMVG